MFVFFFQAEDGIRDLVRSRGLGDVYKRQQQIVLEKFVNMDIAFHYFLDNVKADIIYRSRPEICLLYTSDAADERSSVDLGGRRIIKKKNIQHLHACD